MAGDSPIERVTQLVKEIGVARNRDFKAAGIHQQYVALACSRGVIERIGRGTYALPDRKQTPQQRITETCKRVPQGVICLFSALWFHGLIAQEPEALWMAIDKKGRVPRIDSFPIEFVFSSGDALTQGVMNLGIDGVPIRVYSPMKTVADCFKYADRVGEQVGPAALATAVSSNKYNRQKLLRFAEICRVKQAIAASEEARKEPQLHELSEGQEVPPRPIRVWNRDVLAREVWSEPIRQLAKKYGVSDVAIHKRCKKLGIALPGRRFWAKQASEQKRPED